MLPSPQHISRHLPLRLLGVVLACVMLAGASCGGSDGDDGADDPDPPTTTLTQEEQDEEALRQLAQDWDDTNRAIHLGEASIETADDFLAGDYLETFRQDVQAFLSSEQEVEVSDETGTVIESVTVEGDRGEVVECLVDADVLLDADGEVVNDEVNATRFRTEAERSGDGWRFVTRVTVETYEGELACESE